MPDVMGCYPARERLMLHPTTLLIDACVNSLPQTYRLTPGHLEPHYPGIIGWAGRLARIFRPCSSAILCL
jgi:hypothetical protein